MEKYIVETYKADEKIENQIKKLTIDVMVEEERI